MGVHNNQDEDNTWYDASYYDSYVQGELNSFRKKAWTDLITGHLPKGRALNILDIGTGPGFFACILSQEGHRVTGIDGSPAMLQAAKKNAEKLGVSPEFCHMNYNHLTFARGSFDVIISRNVTWTMKEPEKVYADMMDLLCPGGLLLLYDSNWFYHLLDPETDARVMRLEEEHEKIYGVHRDIAGHIDEETEDMLANHPMVYKDRPEWDKEFLESLGASVTVEADIGKLIYAQWEQHLYQMHPLFEVCAIKN